MEGLEVGVPQGGGTVEALLSVAVLLDGSFEVGDELLYVKHESCYY